MSRVTYCRYKLKLNDSAKGILLIFKKQKALQKPKWGESEMQYVFRLRRSNPTYDKAKITAIKDIMALNGVKTQLDVF